VQLCISYPYSTPLATCCQGIVTKLNELEAVKETTKTLHTLLDTAKAKAGAEAIKANNMLHAIHYQNLEDRIDELENSNEN
jgi:hypothetical protein